jgi:choline dehydrogenase-like flavoprotein
MSAYDFSMFPGRSPMPVNLKPTDVVVVGLGAAGGVAVLPLTQAGLEVIGLEAGTWLTADDFAPDELRNNFRGWPQAVQKANREIPTHRAKPNAPIASARDSPDDERRRRHHAALLGAELAAESLGLQGRQRDDAPLRRVAHSEGSTVEDWPFGLEELEPYYDKVEYEIGVSGQAGNIKGKIDPRGNIFEGARAASIRCRRCAARFTEMMAAPRASSAGIRSRARGHQLARYQKPLGVHVSRLLQPRRLSRRRQGLDRRHDDSRSAGDTASLESSRERTSRRSRSTQRARDGVNYVKGGPSTSSRRKSCCSPAIPTRTRAAAALEVEGVPEWAVEQPRPVGAHYFSHNQIGGVTALFPRTLNSWYGLPAQGVASTTGPTTTSITPASTSSAAAISGSTPIAGRSAAAA